MNNSEYDEAIRNETAWLDQQLVKFVVDELSKRQLGGAITLSDNVLGAIDSAFQQAAAKHAIAPSPVLADGSLVRASPPEETGGHGLRHQIAGAGEHPTGQPIYLRPGLLYGALAIALAAVAWLGWQTIDYRQQIAKANMDVQKANAIGTKLSENFCAASYLETRAEIDRKKTGNADLNLTDAENAVVTLGDAFKAEVGTCPTAPAPDDK